MSAVDGNSLSKAAENALKSRVAIADCIDHFATGTF
jgi:hypothetical protein